MESNSKNEIVKSETDLLLEQYAPLLKNLIRYSSALNAKDISFYKSIEPSIKDKAEFINRQLVDIMNELLMSSTTISNDLNSEDWRFENDSELENNQIMSNILDSLLEKVEINIDNHYKQRKYEKVYQNKNNKLQINSNQIEDGYTYLDPNENTNLTSTNIVPKGNANMIKPQSKFLKSVNNFETSPFKPIIEFKPNAIKSLQDSLKLIEPTDEIPLHYENPYSYEIMNSEYPEWILKSVPENERYESIPWVGSPEAIWIDTPEKLSDLLIELNKCKVIAIDLEHHDYRTYHGLTSLMQITTDTKIDYLIDPLSPELRENLTSLNEIFTNPNIIKVLHGAFMDVIWLQRDLGLYLVSLFDTFHAAKQLSLGKYSLAFLLEEYVKFRTSKKWQLADWRIRPLSNEMRDYAKADTHFLIEIFYKMHEDLLKIPNALQKALYSSRKVANRRFEYPTYRPKNLSMSSNNDVVTTTGGVPLNEEITQHITLNYDKDLPWTNLIYSNGIPLERRPLLEVLFKWRDNEARKNDESARYIMSDFILVSLVNSFEIGHEEAVDINSVMNVINKNSKFGGSYHVRKCIKELTETIKDALVELKGVDLNKLQALNNHLITDIENEETRPSLSLSGISIEDVYSSVKDVSKLQQQFTLFNNFYNKSINLNKPIHIETINDKNENGIFAIEYGKKGKVSVIENKSIKKRIDEIVEFFGEDMSKNVEFEIDAEEIGEEENDEEENIETGINNKEVAPKNEEIITLRKKRSDRINPNTHKRKADAITEAEDLSVDFNKSILEKEPEDRRRSKKPMKKPSFDPYSREVLDEMNIPQLKKKKMVDRSRNIVFKQSKR